MPWPKSRPAHDVWWFFLLVLIGHTALVGFNVYRANRVEAQVSHTLEVLSNINQLRASLIDSETSARGFVIIGDESFLDPYQISLTTTPRVIANLRTLVNDNPLQMSQLAQLEPIIRERLQLIDDVIETRRRPTRDLERETELVKNGKRVMDTLRAKLAVMSSEEGRLLELRNTTAATTLTTSIVTTVLGGVIVLGILALANYLIRREYETRRLGDESLRLSEERFRVIAETLPLFVWTARPDGYVEYFNPSWFAFTGFTPEQSFGLAWSTALHPEDKEHAEKRWKKAIDSGQLYEGEYRWRRHDGVYRWFLGRALPIRDKKGRIVRWLRTCTDIDAQKRIKEKLEDLVGERTMQLKQVVSDLTTEVGERERVTEELRHSALELSRSNHELEQFAYVASHDLQEPLRKIQAFGDRLKTRYGEQLEGQGHEYIERMQTSATRMRRLINDLLTFSRVSARVQPFVPVDLNMIANEVMGDLEDAVTRSSGRIDIGSLPTIDADPLQMRQLMQNLLSNALKFRRPDVSPTVTVRAESVASMNGGSLDQRDRPAIRIEVADNGIGFDPAYGERIFQVFQRLHGRDEYDGTGIGLAIVRKIVERHGGTVTAHGQPGAGATFSVILPESHAYHDPDDSGTILRTGIANGKA